MAVRFVKSGIHWNYEDVRRDLRIYRLEDPRFEGCHISVYLSGDYHAKDKKGKEQDSLWYIVGYSRGQSPV